MKIFSKLPTVNISKLNFWLVICIAKNVIWITLKVIFSIFRFFCTLRFQIYKYCPIITNHTSMESLFIQLKWTLMTGFVLQGHIWDVLTLFDVSRSVLTGVTHHAIDVTRTVLQNVVPEPENTQTHCWSLLNKWKNY